MGWAAPEYDLSDYDPANDFTEPLDPDDALTDEQYQRKYGARW